MDVDELNNTTWFRPLVEQVREEFARLQSGLPDQRAADEERLRQLSEQIQGWRLTLANPNLGAALQNLVISDINAAIASQQEIQQQLRDRDGRQQRCERVLDPQLVADRLTRLEDVLANNNPTLTNIELSLHIDRIDCFNDGRAEMRTCKLGALAGASDLFAVEPNGADSNAQQDSGRATPRRRTLCRVDDVGDGSEELRDLAEYAADPNRFGGLGDQWFSVDVFRPSDEPTSWAAKNSAAVFQRRQDSQLAYSALAGEFGVTSPTIGAAIRFHLATHPGVKDEVRLGRGGRRKPKIDVSKFVGVRQLWEDGWSKLKLAAKYGCSAPTIDKALALAYEREGLAVPKRADRLSENALCARQLFDAGQSLTDVKTTMKISMTSARKYLRASFAAEGRTLPDLRRKS